MKFFRSFQWYRCASRYLWAGICLAPGLLSAHPGHYHPDENDEFDFLRATFVHSHGALDYVIAAMVIGSLMVVCANEKPALRASALAMALGSLALPLIF